MADVLRSCAKTGCRWPAAASLSYRYATRQVWLLDLAAAPDPSLYDLCPHHADHLVVPNGWEQVDDRSDIEVMVEPSASDRAAEAARRHGDGGGGQHEPTATGTGGRNRYAALVEALPRLAAENSQHPATTQHAAPTMLASRPRVAAPTEREPRHAPDEEHTRSRGHGTPVHDADAPSRPTPEEPPLPPSGPAARRPDDARRATPKPSRDHAPVPPAQIWPEPASASDPDEPLPGQLAIPVGDLDEASDGVVVPFELAGSRRRPPRS